jgi:hypothetical protein
MSSCSSSYNHQTVSAASSSYVTLRNYNQGTPGFSPPVPATTVSGVYVVPTWSYPPDYDTLIKGKNNSGYADIKAAYGKDAHNCDPQYIQKPCM